MREFAKQIGLEILLGEKNNLKQVNSQVSHQANLSANSSRSVNENTGR